MTFGLGGHKVHLALHHFHAYPFAKLPSLDSRTCALPGAAGLLPLYASADGDPLRALTGTGR